MAAELPGLGPRMHRDDVDADADADHVLGHLWNSVPFVRADCTIYTETSHFSFPINRNTEGSNPTLDFKYYFKSLPCCFCTLNKLIVTLGYSC